MNVFFRPVLFVFAFILSAITSWFNGFLTAKVMKQFGATDWCFAAFSTIVFPIYLFGMLLLVDVIEFLKKSSAKTPPVTIFIFGLLYMCISMPLCFYGAHVAFRQEKLTTKIKVN